MVLDAAFLNTQHYKVRLIGKVDQSSALSVVAIEKGAFGSPSTKFANCIPTAYVCAEIPIYMQHLQQSIFNLRLDINRCLSI